MYTRFINSCQQKVNPCCLEVTALTSDYISLHNFKDKCYQTPVKHCTTAYLNGIAYKFCMLSGN
ncbi:hypothetical protein CRENPOLYSF2_200012 [Crenothrix polyspora]|uniref:Uncharacterized protein n=1 Tax=Crenothrix polyspora TaxID=360316 RepID=A0A1R4H4E3_9GAMM|nr:hypothetical protein CRENPOLYSF2_200012 [Crenothrix polyspora]